MGLCRTRLNMANEDQALFRTSPCRALDQDKAHMDHSLNR